jgi:hypothetical protein
MMEITYCIENKINNQRGADSEKSSKNSKKKQGKRGELDRSKEIKSVWDNGIDSKVAFIQELIPLRRMHVGEV